MQVIRGLNKIVPYAKVGCVATIGKFDGMHLGHQSLLTALKRESLLKKLPSLVILFEPHPEAFFDSQNQPARLMRLREKLIFLQKQMIDYVLILPFNKKLESMSAQDFAQKVLLDYLHVKHLIIGDDFRFGAKRQGDFTLLQKMSERNNFRLTSMQACVVHNERVSSTKVREALAQADFEKVANLLGRPYSLHGRVSHGDKLGRTLGFPTANIYLHRAKSPVHGIFAVHIRGLSDHPLQGAACIGSRPTVGGTRVLLEVYILDFKQEIYGANVDVDILHKLRDEVHYASLELLTKQIALDVADTRAYFDCKKT